MKPELDELEERIHLKHSTLSEKLSGLSQNVYDLLATNKENMPHLSNLVTQADLERKCNMLSGEINSRVHIQEFERKVGHINDDLRTKITEVKERISQVES